MGMRNKARSLAGLLVLAASLLLAQGALAHAAYERSTPGAGAVVAEAPAQVEIWFTQELFRRQGENWIRVTGPDGAEAHATEALIDDDNRRHMSVTLAPGLPAGEYVVNWRTLSADDGDSEEGSFTFTVDPQAVATSTPMSAATATSQPEAARTPAPAPSPTPDAGGGGCAAALAPALGLVLATGWVRRPRARQRQRA